MSDLREDLPWLRMPAPSKGFTGGTGEPKYNLHKKKETWAFVLTMELIKGPSAKGRIVIKNWQGRSVGRASFSDLSEGNTLFDEAWEVILTKTQEIENGS